jgi:hypothetical protein
VEAAVEDFRTVEAEEQNLQAALKFSDTFHYYPVHR